MKYGYIRVSSKGQALYGNSIEGQKEKLQEEGCDNYFCDIYTGTKIDRPELDKLLSIVKEGDVIIVTKLDRFARSVIEGCQLVLDLTKKGVSVHILNMGKVDNTPTGKLTLHILLAFAEFERDIIAERMQEGKEIARKNPNYHEGRKKKYTQTQIKHALDLLDNNSYSEVVRMTGISKSTLIREKKRYESRN